MNFSPKTTKILYWVTTVLVFLVTVPSAFMITNPMTIETFNHLGVGGDWFRWTLEIGKTIGAILLILPFIKGRVKERVYAAFGIDFICAFIAILSVDGFTQAWFILIFVVVLLISYTLYHRVYNQNMPLY